MVISIKRANLTDFNDKIILNIKYNTPFRPPSRRFISMKTGFLYWDWGGANVGKRGPPRSGC